MCKGDEHGGRPVLVEFRRLFLRFFCNSGRGSLSEILCVPFLSDSSSLQNSGAELFALSTIISLIGPGPGAVVHHLKIYAFTELCDAGNFFDTPYQRNFTTSGQEGLV
ncbi:hypothetical protein TNCV_1047551 [Trichonephila clavipes]|nr:hypothetical protein TNCV_1047551 [Trichonephila clavipes]